MKYALKIRNSCSKKMTQSPKHGKTFLKIAIIDPEIQILDMLRQLFQSNGFQSAVFDSGLDALKQFPSIRPDIVLLEIALKGEDGLSICQAIHKRYPETPIIILSNLRSPEIRLQAIEAGAIDYLTKPYDRAFLLQKIKNLLLLLTQCQPAAPESASPIVRLFSRENLSIIKPEPDPQSPFGYSYPPLSKLGVQNPEDQREELEWLAEEGKLEHIIFDVVKQCPKCHSVNVNFRPVCPECHSPAIQPIPVPGQSVQKPFQETKYQCLHCETVFSTAVVFGKCLHCGENFRESEAETCLIYSYRLPQSMNRIPVSQHTPEESVLEKALQEAEIDYVAPDVLKALVTYEIKQVRVSKGKAFSILKMEFLNFKELERKYDPFSEIRSVRNLLLIIRKFLRPQDQVILGGEDTFSILMPGAGHSTANLVRERLLSFTKRFGFELKFRVSVETYPDTFQTAEDILKPPDHSYSSLKKSASNM